MDLDIGPQVQIRPRSNSLQREFISEIKEIKTGAN